MGPLQPVRALVLLASIQLACTTVHLPIDEPVSEEALAAAIATIHATGAGVAILEDGLQADVYRYEWEDLPSAPRFRAINDSPWESMGRSRMRILTGPYPSVRVPYSWIREVKAHSWPLWAGVEIQLSALPEAELAGPLVIRAGDAEEAARLTDAIDCLRRVRRFADTPLAEVSAPSAE